MSLVSALTDLYELDHNGITEDSWEELDHEIRRRHANPGWVDDVISRGLEAFEPVKGRSRALVGALDGHGLPLRGTVFSYAPLRPEVNPRPGARVQ